MRFAIVCTGWKNWPWIQQTLGSIDEQQVYWDVHVCVVDDASDCTELSEFIEKRCTERGWDYILQPEHKGTLFNQVAAIRKMAPRPEDVIVFLDPDGDRFAHCHALDHLKDAYADGSKVVYSMYTPDRPSPGSAQSRAYPPDVIASNSYRSYAAKNGICHNHLRSFTAELFYAMDESDFKDDDGNWFMSSPDSALMFPALELARGRVKFLPEVLLIYRADHALSDWIKQPKQIDRDHQVILSRPPK